MKNILQIAFFMKSDLNYDSFSPEVIETGVAGSEEALIYLSEELSKLGHKVHVYANCGGQAGDYEGVLWRDITQIDYSHVYDICIFADLKNALDIIANNLKAKQKYLWEHFVYPEADLLPIKSMFTKFIVLSPHSRSQYPNIEDSKFFQTTNGVRIEQFDQRVYKDPLKIVYGSDYDRGLHMLLENWPAVKKVVPDCHLNVFYGWNVFDAKMQRAQQTNPETAAKMNEFKNKMELLLQQDGVNHLGRIGHADVAREFLSAGIWAYPCTFPESCCITAMKAQIAGAMPIAIPTAALDYTVQYGYRTPLSFSDQLSNGEAEKLVNKWLRALVFYLENPLEQEKLRFEMIDQATKAFSWKKIANDWVHEFQSNQKKW